MKSLSVTDRQRLKELTLERTATVPPGKVMWCRDRKVLSFSKVDDLANVVAVPRLANRLCVSPSDYLTIKEWIG